MTLSGLWKLTAPIGYFLGNRPNPAPAQATRELDPNAWKRQATDWRMYDRAASKVFDSFNAPVKTRIENSDYFKTSKKLWWVEYDLDDIAKKIEEPDFPPALKVIVRDTLLAFEHALHDKKHQDFREKADRFTLAFTYTQAETDVGNQSFDLSIGCPLTGRQNDQPPRFYMTLDKSCFLSHMNKPDEIHYDLMQRPRQNPQRDQHFKAIKLTRNQGVYISHAPAPFMRAGILFSAFVMDCYKKGSPCDIELSGGPGFSLTNVYGQRIGVTKMPEDELAVPAGTTLQ